jgi:hypothetical protein
MAPQRFDKIESAPGNGMVSAVPDFGRRSAARWNASRGRGGARSASIVDSARASIRVVGGLGRGH